MAEIAGSLDFTSNAGFSTEKPRLPQGFIPIRWIVAKDVPFGRFHDLNYHEQPVTQVRHGNTIPGEVGRLVVQRYFEAAHWPTATLHPLSHDSTGLTEVSNAVGNRDRFRSRKNSHFHRDRKGSRGGSSRGSRNIMNFAPRLSSLDMNGSSHTGGDYFDRAGRCLSEPSTAHHYFYKPSNSIYGGFSASLPEGFLRMTHRNGLSF